MVIRCDDYGLLSYRSLKNDDVLDRRWAPEYHWPKTIKISKFASSSAECFSRAFSYTPSLNRSTELFT